MKSFSKAGCNLLYSDAVTSGFAASGAPFGADSAVLSASFFSAGVSVEAAFSVACSVLFSACFAAASAASAAAFSLAAFSASSFSFFLRSFSSFSFFFFSSRSFFFSSYNIQIKESVNNNVRMKNQFVTICHLLLVSSFRLSSLQQPSWHHLRLWPPPLGLPSLEDEYSCPRT